MEMNDNTILRIKVPAHLYESVKAQLTLKEGKNDYGMPGAKTIKEKKTSDSKPKAASERPKKTSAPKKANAPVRVTPDNAVKADKDIPGMGLTEKKKLGLEELKALAEMLRGQIAEMEGKKDDIEEYHEPENIYDDEIEDDSKKKVKEARDFSGYFKGSEISNAAAAIDIIDAAIKNGQDVKINGEKVTDTNSPFFTIITGTGEDVQGHKLTKPENLSAITIDGKSIEDQIAGALAKMPKITAADVATPKEIPLSSRFD